MLINVPKLVTAYYTEVPDPSIPAQRVASAPQGITVQPSIKHSTKSIFLQSAKPFVSIENIRRLMVHIRELTFEFGEPAYDRIEAPVAPEQKNILKNLTSKDISKKELACEKIESILTQARGNNAPIGGLQVTIKSGSSATRPSGTENIYKIYAESFRGTDHLRCILKEAQSIVNDALKISSAAPNLSLVNK